MSCTDIKFLFISTVAVFLLYSVMAQRNGPTKIKNPRNIDVFRVPGISFRSPRGIERIFRGGSRGRNPFVSTVVYSSTDSGPSTTRLRQARRSINLGIERNRITKSIMSHPATFIEPMLLEEPKTHFSGHPHNAHDSLGPMIGPLSLPGFGKNLYVRLMVPPDEEDVNYVMVHLVNKPGSISFGNLDESRYFARKPWPGKSTNEVKKLIFDRPESFTEKPVDHFISKPFAVPEMNWNPMHQVPLPFNGQPEHRAAPNHHQLPIVLRPADNLIDLPIYPPLDSVRSRNVQMGASRGAIRSSGNEAVVSNGGQTNGNIFGRIMQQSTALSKFAPLPPRLYSGAPSRGGIASSNVGSSHVLTAGHSIDEMARNVAGTNADHSLNDEISGTERPHETSRVNDPQLDNQSNKHGVGNSNENIH